MFQGGVLQIKIEFAGATHNQSSGTLPPAGTFNNAGTNGNWWSATENGASNAWNRNMNSGNGDVNENNNDKGNGFSVLCSQDCAGEAVNRFPLFYEAYRLTAGLCFAKKSPAQQMLPKPPRHAAPVFYAEAVAGFLRPRPCLLPPSACGGWYRRLNQIHPNLIYPTKPLTFSFL